MVSGILIAMAVVGAVGLFIGLFLGIAGIKFKVEVDEREEAVLSALPGNNCGGCGYAGCANLAAAIAKGEAPVNACPVGGEPVGKEIAKTLAAKGALVIVNYCGSAKRAEETVQEIEAAGGKAEALQCDISDFTKAGEMMDYVIKTYGRVDILVNNAGITRDGLLMKMSEEDFDAVLNTNLKGAFNCMRHVARQMVKQRGGRIINISSVSGVMGNAGQVNYSASKAGIIGMTKSAARELASRGITVNAVAPGFVNTEMTEVLSDSVKEAATAQIPLKTFGETKDIAYAVAFLASDEARYITGQVLCVDGGMAM